MADKPPFVVDLHAHYPMQFDPEQEVRRRYRRAPVEHETWLEKARFAVLSIADRFFNRERPTDGHAVTIDTLVEGNVGLALSVAYWAFSEIDVHKSYGAAPEDDYLTEVVRILQRVEDEVAKDPKKRARIVRDVAELDAALAAGKVALIHAIEGGFHVGGTDEGIRRGVARLAKMGLGYVTVAHLFYRAVATNVPALPFMPDVLYRALFPQDAAIGLTARGETLVREMVKHGILVDLTHMSELGMKQTFELLDRIDPAKEVPVIATHIACSMGPGGYAYNLKEEFVRRIADRGGVCGVLYCEHYMMEGSNAKKTRNIDESFRRIDDHVDKLLAWGGEDILAIGSDLDGFIKPTLEGLSSARNHQDVARHLLETKFKGRPALAEKMCHANALRVFRQAWMKKRP